MANSPLNLPPDDENTPLPTVKTNIPRGEEFDFDTVRQSQAQRKGFWKSWGGWSILVGVALLYCVYTLGALSRDNAQQAGAPSPFLTQNVTPAPAATPIDQTTKLPAPTLVPTLAPTPVTEPDLTAAPTENQVASAEPPDNKMSDAALAELKAHPINLNTATLQELLRLPHIGQKTAGYILAYRTENGPFQSVEDLDKIQGIGAKRLEALRPLVVVR